MRDCKTCDYEAGEECHRWPPTVLNVDLGGHKYCTFPKANCWCGEYKARQSGAEQQVSSVQSINRQLNKGRR